MVKINRISIFLILATGVFLFSSYWIYKNVRLEDLIGDSNVSLDIENDAVKVKERKFEIRNKD